MAATITRGTTTTTPVELTDWARDILERSQAAARRFTPDAVIRLTRTASGMDAVLAEHPEEGDAEVRVAEITLWVEEGIEGLVDVEEPHDRIVLRPAGSTPNPRGAHAG